MIAESLADNLGRVLIGQGKPLITVHTPPGAISWVLIPALAVLLVVALMPTRRAEGFA